jgi:hypothetical protein
MSSIADFVCSLQKQSIIEVKDTTELIEKTIKDTFNSIQHQLISNIKNTVQDELIKKLSNEDINDKPIIKIDLSKDPLVSKYLNKMLLKKDECFIKHITYSYQDNPFRDNFIIYTTYNNIYTLKYDYDHLSHNWYHKVVKLGKEIKLTRALISFVIPLFQFLRCDNLYYKHSTGDGIYHNRQTDELVKILTKDIPDTIYEFQEKYYANNKFGVYGSKFESIIDQFYKSEKELENKNIELEKAKEEITLLKEENKGLKKELEDCDQLRQCMANLKNTFITS